MQVPRWSKIQLSSESVVAYIIIIALLVFTIELYLDGQHQQNCADAYASAQYDAQHPVDIAQRQLNAADALIWEANQRILTQQAGPDDYRALRVAVKERNTLWENLEREQAANPVPPPPDQFC